MKSTKKKSAPKEIKRKKGHGAKTQKPFNLERMTVRERYALFGIIECTDEGPSCSFVSLKEFLKADEEVLLVLLKKLERNECIVILDPDMNCGQIMIMERARSFMEDNHPDGHNIEECNMKVRDVVHPGKRSQFSGKRLFRKVSENPRREGTHGWHSWKAITYDGIPYEDYLTNRGRLLDLSWEVKKGRVEVK